MIRSRRWLMQAAPLMALTGCVTAPEGSSLTGAKYVALGSSFAAGAGIGPLQPGTPPRCGRTTNNYASLLARKMRLALTDMSCGGAKTANILSPWVELPAQIDAVTADTRLITVTIGGNDIGYAQNLMAASCRAGANFRPGACIPKFNASEADYRKLEENLQEIGRQVASRAPQARLVFVQYVTLVPPAPCDAALLKPEDAEENRAMGLRLAEITARAARDAHAIVLPVDEMSRDHTPCSAVPWSHGMSAGYDMRQGSPWHPNAAGHAAIAEALAARLSRHPS